MTKNDINNLKNNLENIKNESKNNELRKEISRISGLFSGFVSDVVHGRFLPVYDENDRIVCFQGKTRSTGTDVSKIVKGHLSVGRNELEQQQDEAALREFLEKYDTVKMWLPAWFGLGMQIKAAGRFPVTGATYGNTAFVLLDDNHVIDSDANVVDTYYGLITEAREKFIDKILEGINESEESDEDFEDDEYDEDVEDDEDDDDDDDDDEDEDDDDDEDCRYSCSHEYSDTIRRIMSCPKSTQDDVMCAIGILINTNDEDTRRYKLDNLVRGICNR